MNTRTTTSHREFGLQLLQHRFLVHLRRVLDCRYDQHTSSRSQIHQEPTLCALRSPRWQVYWCRLRTLQHIVQLVLFELLQLSLQISLKTTSENLRNPQPRRIAHIIKFETSVWSRQLVLDLNRNLRLFLDLLHGLVNLVKCARRRL